MALLYFNGRQAQIVLEADAPLNQQTNQPTNLPVWDLKFSRRRVWCSELFSGMYCRVK
jgi:hypothetical protein